MTVNRIVVVCLVVFGVMCGAFLPLGVGILEIGAIPFGPRLALAIIVVVGLWWGPFAYSMYLTMVVIPNGDQRLVRRGVKGSADVVADKLTGQYSRSRAFGGDFFRVHVYQLLVDVPGKSPYMARCSIAAPEIEVNSRVPVAVSRFNKKRVTIDFTRDLAGDQQAAGLGVGGTTAGWVSPADAANAAWVADAIETDADEADADELDKQEVEASRLVNIERLGELHRQGVLTDAEFAAEKARILGE